MVDPSFDQARALEKSGDVAGALKAFQSVAAASPSYAEARIRVVGILLLLNRAAEAETAARDFVKEKPDRADAHATLGQVLRLSHHFEGAEEAFARALHLRPGDAGLEGLLNDARRSRFWSPDADLIDGLRVLINTGKAAPTARQRYFHGLFLGLLNPEVLAWLVDHRLFDREETLPDRLRKTLDGRYQGRFSAALAEAVAAWKAGQLPKAVARVTLQDGKTVEGPIEDSDGTIGAALEAILGAQLELIPFADLKSVELSGNGLYATAAIVRADGSTGTAQVPALYFFSENCRLPEIRDGRLTVWREFEGGLHVALGLRDFRIADKLINQLAIRKIEIISA